jgi:hypothetical protein
LQDGVPLNKSDGGSVNWNALDPLAVEQVDVLKGPGSSIHGGKCYGGGYQLISAIPTKPFQGSLRPVLRTFETATKLTWTFREEKATFTGGREDSNRLSDAMLPLTPQEIIDEYHCCCFPLMNTRPQVALAIYFPDQHLLEAGIGYYSGKRGTGTLMKAFDLAAPRRIVQ